MRHPRPCPWCWPWPTPGAESSSRNGSSAITTLTPTSSASHRPATPLSKPTVRYDVDASRHRICIVCTWPSGQRGQCLEEKGRPPPFHWRILVRTENSFVCPFIWAAPVFIAAPLFRRPNISELPTSFIQNRQPLNIQVYRFPFRSFAFPDRKKPKRPFCFPNVRQ